MPPNTPYLSLTLADSVVVEQRRLGNLWLDEVSYYLHRVTQWRTNPIFYDYLDTDLQDEQYVASQLVPLLLEVFRMHGGATRFDQAIRRRVAASMLALATQEKHYRLSESTRRSLQGLLESGEDGALAALLREPWPCLTPSLRAGGQPTTAFPVPSVQEYLERFYWQTDRYWPKSGCIMHPPVICAPQLYTPALLEQCHEELTATGVPAGCVFLPVVYAQSRPVYGTEVFSLQETVSEYFSMKDLESQRKELFAFLRSRKSEHDELLDELF
ncbi:hypothetical protein STCU_07734 [Strigomonas culicis]|nr:hypothetical protein STCU_07734 [Strigomonas culicis]|eukprot:EPY23390.1 hypothetical protein STCU_07734 [Strigomonas culicis]